MVKKRIFISADHGLAIVYFLQSDVVPSLLEAGVEVILLTDDEIHSQIENRFGSPGLTIEGLRLERANTYAHTKQVEIQWWLNFLRRVGSSKRINTEAMDSYIYQVEVESGRKRRFVLPMAKALIAFLRRSATARRMLVSAQMRYNPQLYSDLFERYKPDLVLASTPGWRLDRYLLREAASKGIPTAAVVVGWDNPSSYSVRGSKVDWITCWSELQKEELILGSDWSPKHVNIGGIPSYDGYFRKSWLIPRQEYYRLHNLDPHRKLISYAASFVSFSPNYQNIEALARLVSGTSDNELIAPSQLLVRLHPNHFWDHPLYSWERVQIQQLAEQYPHVHVVEPVPLGGSLGYYSGEDMPEKTSMMAHSDVFVTVYSTMVVEAAIHDSPIVSACIDAPNGWDRAHKYSLPLSQIGDWPTHQRFRQAGAGRVALDERSLGDLINLYLQDPSADQENRQRFIRQECTFTDGSAGSRTAAFILSILENQCCPN
jgi:hypothetical protein